MKPASIMTDVEDEVNIAQFHPIPGMGMLYGTKRGKVRMFRQ
jgi:activator-of-BECN1-regulated-autophagy protein 1